MSPEELQEQVKTMSHVMTSLTAAVDFLTEKVEKLEKKLTKKEPVKADPAQEENK